MAACTKSRSKTMEQKSKRINVMQELIFQNLTSLQCPFQELGRKSGISLHRQMLDKPNKLGLTTIFYFLFCKLDEKRSHHLFKHLYPPYDRKQELEFQKISLSWWKECAKSNNEYTFPMVPPNLFMKAGGQDVITFVYEFSAYVLYSSAKRLCPQDDYIFLPPKSSQNPRIVAFQKVSLKGAVSGTMSRFSWSAQLSQQEDFEIKAQVDSMLARYREHMDKVKDLKRAKSMLMERLKNTHNSSHSSVSRKDDIRMIAIGITSDLNLVRKMWDIVICSTDETAVDREIVRSILSRNKEGKNLNALKLGVKIPSSLIKDCNQEVSERVGPTLYQAEQLNLVGFIRLVNIMLQQILLKLHEGLPNFDGTVTVLKAHNIVHTKCSGDLAKVQHNFDVKIPQVKKMNEQYREKVDRCNRQWNLNNGTLIPGLPCPNLPSTNRRCSLTDGLDIATTSFSNMSPTITYSLDEVNLMPVILPSTVVVSSEKPISEGKQKHVTHGSRVPNDLAAMNSELSLWDSFSSLKQGNLSFGPSSPLKQDHLLDTVAAKCLQPRLLQQVHSSKRTSSANQHVVIDEAKPRQPALDKLVDRVVDFTLHDTDSCSDVPQCDTNLLDIDDFDVGCQLDALVFVPVDKVMRSPPQKSGSLI